MFRRFEHALLDIREASGSKLFEPEQQLLADLYQVTFADKPLSHKVGHLKMMLNHPSSFLKDRLGYLLTARCSDRSLQRDPDVYNIQCENDEEHRRECLHMYLNKCLDEAKPFYAARCEKRETAVSETEETRGPSRV